ncbi:MAG: FAD-binding oxidoreductase [Candidatus Methanoliparum thermophilum]|uniref:D-lactate dehydrogenase (cytochrome) n=1 Tax=Methanoliparum thermophilum TaxID=2491083 RepID=A0A520KTZ6_METT2|nr:FAD-binding oxidoreductase [Candidatus Methanoliparum sp. LAM-1]RZN65552.1 MAG: FAD-binding oxidoreductase [Candidatus Methanoliparum thermophilum]BDC35350.1 hypothetical protein MTLP_00320 [Candidatus Methanoliparum sp. LAM-1]
MMNEQKKFSNDRIFKLLCDAVGEENVSNEDAILAAYSRDNQWPFIPPHLPDYIVRPITTEEVQKVLRIANRYRIPVIPMSSGINVRGLCIPTYGGIILELKRMKKLEIDEDMRTATVQPGVTIARLVAESAKKGLKPAVPGAPATVSPVSNYTLRGVYHHITSEGMDQVLSATVVLPTGEILHTGSRAFPKADPNFRYFGPDLFGLFQGQPGTMGVVTEMTVRLFEKPEKTEVMMNFYGDVKKAIQFSDEVAKAGVASSQILMTWGVGLTTLGFVKSKFTKEVFSILFSMAPWMTQTIVEGDEDAVEYKKNVVNKIVKRLNIDSKVTYDMVQRSDLPDGVKKVAGVTPSVSKNIFDILTSEEVLSELGTGKDEVADTGINTEKMRDTLGVGEFRPVTPDTIEYEFRYPRKIAHWFSLGDYWALAWWGPLDKVDLYYEKSKDLWVKCGLDPVDFSLVAYPVYPYSGKPAYVEIDAWMDFVSDPSSIDKVKMFTKKETDLLLNDVGIYAWFRPYRDVIKQSLPQIKGYYIPLWKKLKELLDPNNIMNPGALFDE